MFVSVYLVLAFVVIYCVFFSSLYCIFLLVICVEGADVTFIYYGLLDLHRPGLEVRR